MLLANIYVGTYLHRNAKKSDLLCRALKGPFYLSSTPPYDFE